MKHNTQEELGELKASPTMNEFIQTNSVNHGSRLVAVSLQQQSASATPPSSDTSRDVEAKVRKAPSQWQLKKSRSDISSMESRARKYHEDKRKKKTSKSSDTDLEPGTGRFSSHCWYSSSYDTDNEDGEKPNMKLRQLVNDKSKAAMGNCA